MVDLSLQYYVLNSHKFRTSIVQVLKADAIVTRLHLYVNSPMIFVVSHFLGAKVSPEVNGS